MTKSQAEFDYVTGLIAEGYNNSEISRLARISRTTVRAWRSGACHATVRAPQRNGGLRCSGGHDFSSLPPKSYCYLLGLYLGDGCIAAHRREVYRLRIVMDASYPEIIDEAAAAMEALMPGQQAHCQPRKSRCVEVGMYSKHWPCLFPQHGPGRKHHRLIRLEPWQEKHVEAATESLLRGLIHSDGCRVVANDRGVASVRYHFSNRSEDIKAIYCAALDRLEIPWTRPSGKDIDVYRKAATARMDEFIGPKR